MPPRPSRKGSRRGGQQAGPEGEPPWPTGAHFGVFWLVLDLRGTPWGAAWELGLKERCPGSGEPWVPTGVAG